MWYERRKEGLGERFLKSVNKLLRRIDENPLLYAIVHKDARRAIVETFPYLVYYRLVGDEVIVVAVFHAKRKPRAWQARIDQDLLRGE